jgi:hypothetical protein
VVSCAEPLFPNCGKRLAFWKKGGLDARSFLKPTQCYVDEFRLDFDEGSAATGEMRCQ